MLFSIYYLLPQQETPSCIFAIGRVGQLQFEGGFIGIVEVVVLLIDFDFLRISIKKAVPLKPDDEASGALCCLSGDIIRRILSPRRECR